MMKKLLWPLILICLLAFPVAANNVPNLAKSGSIHISMQYDGSPVSGGEFMLYRVGEIQESDGNYSFRLVDPFASSEVTLENVHAFETAKKLSDYALRNGIDGQRKQIGKNGTVDFEDLETGLYLLTQRKAASGYDKVNPFLVSLPMRSADDYIYQVDASPKVSPLHEKPPNPEQPATGQSGWPIWIFVCSSASLIVLTTLRRRDKKKL